MSPFLAGNPPTAAPALATPHSACGLYIFKLGARGSCQSSSRATYMTADSVLVEERMTVYQNFAGHHQRKTSHLMYWIEAGGIIVLPSKPTPSLGSMTSLCLNSKDGHDLTAASPRRR